jgi:nicotinamide-nucleotide amidase
MNGLAEMIFTGDELLRGDVVNSNQAYLGERLLETGLLATKALSILDDRRAITGAIIDALRRGPALLILSGGLGPTEDDLTREAVSDALARPLVLHEELLDAIRQRFSSLGMQMSDTNRKQALLPDGATAIPFTGTAPGFWLVEGETLLAALPGVPQELRQMWNETLAPLVRARQSAGGPPAEHLVRRLRIYGMGESTLAEALRDLSWRGGSIDLGTRASLDGLTLILRARPEPEAHRQLDALEAQIRAVLGEKVFGSGHDSLAEVVGRQLSRRGLTLVVAESCTGGLLGKLLTDVAGSSSYFLGGAITYSNELKTRLLGVPRETVEKYGAVSEETAAAMARGVRERLGGDAGLAVTGIAGPDGGTAEKPVGLVFIGLALENEVQVRRFLLFRSRDDVRVRAAHTALDVLRRALLA